MSLKTPNPKPIGLGLLTGQGAPVIDDYVTVDGSKVADTKSAAAEVPKLYRPPQMRSTMAKSGVKLETTREVRLPVSFQMINTAANLCQAVLAVDMTASSEWVDFQALYDQYRFVRATAEFIPTTTGLATSGDGGMMVLAYDSVDNTVLSSVRNGTELSRSKLFNMTNFAAGFAAIPCTCTANAGDTFRFSFKPDEVKQGEALSITAAGAVTASAGAWKNLPSAGSNGSVDGYLKVYWANNVANSVVAAAGILQYYVQFRSRK